jgi:hypothetical protein
VRRAGAVIWEENPRREKFLEAMLGKMQEEEGDLRRANWRGDEQMRTLLCSPANCAEPLPS